MTTKRRKVEVHCLTISGLPDGTAYDSFLRNLRGRTRPVAEMIMKSGDKSHGLNKATLRNHRLHLRFLSYTKGHRPDVLDTNQFALQPNPLTPAQTNVEWTHALGARKDGRYVLLIERNFNGIWPTALERYLQWMIDRFHDSEPGENEGDNEPVTVSLEMEPGLEFMERMNALDRITEATVRIVRPNPGFRDLDTELGEMAAASDARKVDLTTTARRRKSLKKRDGIVKWIRDRFDENRLGYTAIKGWNGQHSETFNTEKLGKYTHLNLEMDDRGQIIADDAWDNLATMMDELD